MTAHQYLESYILQTSAFPQARIQMLLPLHLRTRLQMHIYHRLCPKGLSFFKGKDPSLIAALTSRCEVQIFETGEALCREGDSGNKVRLFFLLFLFSLSLCPLTFLYCLHSHLCSHPLSFPCLSSPPLFVPLSSPDVFPG